MTAVILRTKVSVIVATALVSVATAFVLTARARARAHSLMCAGRLFPLTFIAMEWAEENESDRYPTDISYLSNRIVVKWLICPSDTSRQSASDWSSFTPEHSSYEIVSPGLLRTDTNSPLLRCRVHGHTSYGDFTVFDGVRRRHKYEGGR